MSWIEGNGRIQCFVKVESVLACKVIKWKWKRRSSFFVPLVALSINHASCHPACYHCCSEYSMIHLYTRSISVTRYISLWTALIIKLSMILLWRKQCKLLRAGSQRVVPYHILCVTLFWHFLIFDNATLVHDFAWHDEHMWSLIIYIFHVLLYQINHIRKPFMRNIQHPLQMQAALFVITLCNYWVILQSTFIIYYTLL